MVCIKVCGITRVEDALMAADLGYHAVSFNFYPKSKRYLEPAAARRIIRQLPPFLQTVGVFYNASLAEIKQAQAASGCGVIQLHGQESPELCSQISQPVIKAFAMQPDFDFSQLKAYKVGAFLLDTFSTELAGGTGQSFDWNLALKARPYGRLILAGGLSAYNLREALEKVQPYGVDLNSGVETRPGEKNAQKMKAAMDIIKQFNK